jgi:HK97 family phage portal protein
MSLRSWLRGEDLIENGSTHGENRALTRGNVPSSMLPYSRSALLDVNTANALRVADAYACVRVLADAVASLPLKVYRKTTTGRVPAGSDSRAVQLLERPYPGSTSADLLSTLMVHLCVNGNAFLGKFRSEGEIVQLGLLNPEQVTVELKGQRVIYTISRTEGVSEHGPEDILHLKAMGSTGVTGLSPVQQARLTLSLSANLQEHAKQYFEEGSRPSGILTVGNDVASPSDEGLDRLREEWRNKQGGVEKMHRVAVIGGDAKFTPIAFSADDSQFLQQRQLSATEVARIFRVPPWLIGAPTGDSLTYANVLDQNRHFVTHSLRPWLVRIERAISNDSDLCPGTTYVQFDLDGLLRADAATRSEIYTRALDPITGWMRRDEVRELEELPPEREAGNE